MDDTHFSVNGKVIQVVSSRDPLQLPWKALDIDLVIEGTGVFIDTKGASKHIEAGAKKVRFVLMWSDMFRLTHSTMKVCDVKWAGLWQGREQRDVNLVVGFTIP